MDLIEKLARGKKITNKDIETELYEICHSTHAFCEEECPVYRINNGCVNPNKENRGCACFMNGKAMLKFIRTH